MGGREAAYSLERCKGRRSPAQHRFLLLLLLAEAGQHRGPRTRRLWKPTRNTNNGEQSLVAGEKHDRAHVTLRSELDLAGTAAGPAAWSMMDVEIWRRCCAEKDATTTGLTISRRRPPSQAPTTTSASDGRSSDVHRRQAPAVVLPRLARHRLCGPVVSLSGSR